MLSSTTLELAIGMAFIYLLLSLFCTAINEAIAGILSSRARNLERGLRSLFTEGTVNETDDAGAVVNDDKGKPQTISLTDAVYQHGLVQSLYESGAGKGIARWWGGAKRLPSYIPARTFVSVMVDLLFPDAGATTSDQGATALKANLTTMLSGLDKLPDSKAKQALQALVRQAGGDMTAARKALEDWFNDGMDRVSGWYKRKTQLVLFCLGLSLAFTLNIDSIHIARALWTDPALRAYTVSAASKYAADNPLPPTADTQPVAAANATFAQLQSLALPIGWNGDGPLQWVRDRKFPQVRSPEILLFALCGWLLTGLAMTLGAPFWFDTLNKFMVVRSTVKPREKSEVEPSKDS